jgi:hypothetical protein
MRHELNRDAIAAWDSSAFLGETVQVSCALQALEQQELMTDTASDVTQPTSLMLSSLDETVGRSLACVLSAVKGSSERQCGAIDGVAGTSERWGQ